MRRSRRAAVVTTFAALLWMLAAAQAAACALDGWLMIDHAGEGATTLTVRGGDFPPGDVIIRSGSTGGPVIGEAVAGPDGRFVADVTLEQPAVSSLKVLAEPVDQLDPGSRVLGWTFVGDAVAPAPSSPPLVPVTVIGAIVVLVAAAVISRNGRGGGGDRDLTGAPPLGSAGLELDELATRPEEPEPQPLEV